jgi:two-component system cell cycle response regulator DivK
VEGRHIGKRILIVEDSNSARAILVKLLTYYGYETIEAEGATEGVEKALSGTPNLIIMDLALPGISGIDAVKAMKKNPRTAHIPIIALTGSARSELREGALNAGVVAYLEKPASIGLMKETLEKYLPA